MVQETMQTGVTKKGRHRETHTKINAVRTYEAWEIAKEKSKSSLLLIGYRLLTTTAAT